MTWLLLATLATAAVPADLDALVALALERDPAVLALSRDAEAARAAADAARTPMNPELMVGVDALGAPADAADPTMAMVGVEQMLQGWGQARAQAARVELDATRAESDRARVEADLRLLLAQSAVRIRAERDDAALLDEQIRQAAALREVGLRRWRSGAAPGGGGMSPGMPAGGMDEMPESAPPRVEPRKSGGGGMAGMSGG
ncbi:MAG: TolC family protein, partial [Myxococcota bacterium]